MSKAIILFHGFMTDENDFKNISHLLDSEYDEVVYARLPGHGEDDIHNFVAEYTIKYSLDLFDDVNKRHGDIDVIGFSMGGAIATFLAKEREFNRLVLLAPANKYLNWKLVFSRTLFSLKYLLGFRTDLDKEKREQILDTAQTNDRISMKMAFRELLPNYTFHTITNFMKVIKMCNENDEKHFNNETLIIWGKLDQLVPMKSIEYVSELCDNEQKKMVIFEDISHLMLGSINYEKIAVEIMTFLKK